MSHMHKPSAHLPLTSIIDVEERPDDPHALVFTFWRTRLRGTRVRAVGRSTFETEEQALKLANDTEYGLYAAVYTKNLDRAMRFAKGLESGMVGVNCTSPTGAWDMPFGGYKQSGVGRESLLRNSGLALLSEWAGETTSYSAW